jgi:small subunit ribosomal protein S9
MSSLNIASGNAATPATLGGLTDPTQPVVPAAQPARPPRAAKPADKRGWWWGTGRRKRAVAQIRMRPADGDKVGITIVTEAKPDARTVEQFFAEERDRNVALDALRVTDMLKRLQVVAKVHGGGYMGQAGAIRLAIANALRDYDPNLEGVLRDNGYLTRDSREVERKKYGQAGARRRFQFSKR